MKNNKDLKILSNVKEKPRENCIFTMKGLRLNPSENNVLTNKKDRFFF